MKAPLRPRTSLPVVEPADPPLPLALMVLGVVVLCLVAVLSATIETLYVPYYIGSVIFPITVPIAVVLNLALARMARIITDRSWPVALPAAAWVLTAIVLGFTNTGGGDVVVPGYGDGQWVGLALFFGGTLAAFVGVVREVGRAAAPNQISSGSSARR